MKQTVCLAMLLAVTASISIAASDIGGTQKAKEIVADALSRNFIIFVEGLQTETREILVQNRLTKKTICRLNATSLLDDSSVEPKIVIAADEDSFCVAGRMAFNHYALKDLVWKTGALLLQKNKRKKLGLIKDLQIVSAEHCVLTGWSVFDGGTFPREYYSVYSQRPDVLFSALINYAKHARRDVPRLKHIKEILCSKVTRDPLGIIFGYAPVKSNLSKEITDKMDQLIARTKKPDDIAIARKIFEELRGFALIGACCEENCTDCED